MLHFIEDFLMWKVFFLIALLLMGNQLINIYNLFK